MQHNNILNSGNLNPEFEIIYRKIHHTFSPKLKEILKSCQNFTDAEKYKICLQIIKRDGAQLNDVPLDLLTHEVCYHAVKQNPKIISVVPDKFKSVELCLVACKKTKDAFLHTPSAYLTEDFMLRAIKKNAAALAFLPAELRTSNFYLKAIKSNLDVFTRIPQEHLSKEICLYAVENNCTYFMEVPKEIRTLDFYIEALLLNSGTKNYIPDRIAYEVFFAAVKKNGILLRDAPERIITVDMIKNALQNNPEAFPYVPKSLYTACGDFLTPYIEKASVMAPAKLIPAPLSDEDRVKADYTKIYDVEKSKRSRTMYLNAISQCGIILEIVPKEQSKNDAELCLAAVLSAPEALRYVPCDLAEKDYTNICTMAVQKNPDTLKFVPQKIRQIIINSVTPEHILSYNYELIDLLLEDIESNERVANYLRSIRYVVVTSSDQFYRENEFKDCFYVYANHNKRFGKTIRCDKLALSKLFADLKITNNNITLVLLGHTSEKHSQIADIFVDDLADLIKRHTFIEKIVLFGCNTVKSNPLGYEEIMIKDYQEKYLRLKNDLSVNPYALALSLNEIDADISKKLLDKTGLKHIFVLSQPASDKYILQYIERKLDSEETCIVNYPIMYNQFKQLQTIFLVNGKKFPFPINNLPIYFRGTEGSANFTKKELNALLVISNQISVYNAQQTNSKQLKQIYPFLTNINIEEDEAYKLTSSYMEKLVEQLMFRTELSQNVKVKGYTNYLYVDTKLSFFHVTRTFLYQSWYKTTTSSANEGDKIGFFSHMENINRKKLADERENHIYNMEEGASPDETIAKSITINILSSNA